MQNKETFPNFLAHSDSPKTNKEDISITAERIENRLILRGRFNLKAADLNTLPEPLNPIASCIVNIRSLKQKRGETLYVLKKDNMTLESGEKITNESVRKGGFFNIDITDVVAKFSGPIEVSAEIGNVKSRPIEIHSVDN